MNQPKSPFYRVCGIFSVAKLMLVMAMTITLTLGACSSWLPDAHRLEMVQGNAITPEQVSELRVGMPKAEVRSLIGVPILEDPFHDQRWDYIFRYVPEDASVKQSRLTLHFEDDILIRIDDSEYIDPDTILPPPTLEN